MTTLADLNPGDACLLTGDPSLWFVGPAVSDGVSVANLNTGAFSSLPGTTSVLQPVPLSAFNGQGAALLKGTFGVANGGASASSLLNGLVSYWKLDEVSGTRADSVGTNALSDVGGVGSVAGKVGNAAAFSGSNHLTCPSNAPLQAAGPFTFAGWFRAPDVSGDGTFFGKYGGQDGSYALLYEQGNLWWYVGPDRFAVKAATFGPISPDAWYFVACGHDGTNQWISVNAGARDEQGCPGATATGDDFNVGSYGDGQIPVTGNVDELGFWNRSLTVMEVARLYNGGNGLTYPF